MDLSSWETINAASGAGASFMAKAASHFQQVAGNISGAGIVTNSAESSNIKNSIKPFAKADDSNEEAWIMGRKYYTQSDFHILKREIRSRLWFSYRKDFPPIGESGMTSDRGWGCMLRCGQMVVAECLQRINIGRDFRWNPSEASPQYLDLLPLFADGRSALYGVHQLSMVTSDQKPVGTWFGPNAVAQAIKKMTAYDPEQRLQVYVAMNTALIISEIMSNSLEPWKPLLLFIPVRLGINEINRLYFESLKACFELEQCAGVIGGRPNHALYFLGYTCDDLICLDPHETQTAMTVGTKSSPDEEEADMSYHTDQFYRWHMDQLDPSISLCFFCDTKESFKDLIQQLQQKVNKPQGGLTMFEIYEKPIEQSLSNLESVDDFNASDAEEFEII